MILFSWTPGINQMRHKRTIPKFNQVLTITVLPQFILVNITG